MTSFIQDLCAFASMSIFVAVLLTYIGAFS